MPHAAPVVTLRKSHGTSSVVPPLHKTQGRGALDFSTDGKKLGPPAKLGVQSGQTNTRTYFGLPHGAQIIYDGTSVVYQHPDLMGNGILGTNNALGKVFDRFFAPFGEEYANSGSTVADFTGHTQDLDPNLYDFTFREDSPVQGRWLNPDPSGMSAVSLGDPQTLNRYSYVRNSAMGMVDPNGLRGNGMWAYIMSFNVSGGLGGINDDGGISEQLDLYLNDTVVTYTLTKSPQNIAKSPQKPKKDAPKPPKPKLFVKANAPINNQSSKLVTTREVDYHSVTANGDYSKDHVLGLKEKCTGSCNGVSNAGSGNEQKNPYLIHEGEYEDQQTVWMDHPYTMEKRWSIDGQPAQVLDPNNKSFDYEVLHNTNDSTPHFETEYKNDSPN